MEKVIIEMIELAERDEDLDLLDYLRRLVEELADTINYPSDWRSIDSRLAEKYQDNDLVYGYMQLYNYED